MVVDDVTRKGNFLGKILKFAEENPAVITEEGRGIFSADCAPVEEGCVIGLHVDNVGKAYFKAKGTYLSFPNPGRIYSPQVLLTLADRYFSKSVDKFQNSFFLTETKDGGKDLLDVLR